MSDTQKPQVGLVMGSDSDWPIVSKAALTFKDFNVPFEVRVISAHRTPTLAAQYAQSAANRGLRVIIAAAGGAAHLGGVLAAHTTLPVLGIPVTGGALNGIDALLATLQMPAGIPVATLTLGGAGAVNAALFAIQILALSDAALADKLVTHKEKIAQKVQSADAKIALALSELMTEKSQAQK